MLVIYDKLKLLDWSCKFKRKKNLVLLKEYVLNIFINCCIIVCMYEKKKEK